MGSRAELIAVGQGLGPSSSELQDHWNFLYSGPGLATLFIDTLLRSFGFIEVDCRIETCISPGLSFLRVNLDPLEFRTVGLPLNIYIFKRRLFPKL